MTNFVPNRVHLREALIFCYHLKKSAAESHRMLVEAYGNHVLNDSVCREWFRRFKSGDFSVEDKQRSGGPKKFEDAELQALLDKDDTQTQKQLAEALNVDQSTISNRLHAMGKIQEKGKWITKRHE